MCTIECEHGVLEENEDHNCKYCTIIQKKKRQDYEELSIDECLIWKKRKFRR